MAIDIELYFRENRAHIQRHLPLGPHTIEIAEDPDLTKPRDYD